ncbi:uncharacterized protein LOC131955233 [Physella acuta]|uniref:uncharacterized protein LOC131955233 n=1 Tax=Physella acuta TaxID=109671 RepID=UPI0027DD2E3B|nr:uncharacterized protein LOC131955233 [Physella acuta]
MWHAKILSIALAAASFIFSVPYAIINGRQTKKIVRPNNVTVTGFECTVDDAYLGTIWPLLNAGFFVLLFVVCCVPLVVLYILIGLKAWRHSEVYGVKAGAQSQSAASESSTSGDMMTKSSSVSNSVKQTRSKSYIRKQSDEKERKNETDGKILGVSAEDNNEDNVIEFVKADVKESSAVSDDVYAVKMTRGPRVPNVNLSMVRELTVKLKAVQKATENQVDENNDAGSNTDKTGHDTSDVDTPKINNGNSEDHPKLRSEIEMPKTAKEYANLMKKRKLETIDSCEGENYDAEKGQETGEGKCTKNSGSLSRRVTHKTKPEDNEGADGDKNNPEKSNSNKNDEEIDEAPSDFAKMMQWVDITYCLNGDNPDQEIQPDTEDGPSGTLAKKCSFTSSRKISRDNSFLKKHRKLREALTDTLTRARKSKKDKEVDRKSGSGVDQNDKIDESYTDTTQNGNHVDENTNEDDKKVDGNLKPETTIQPSEEKQIISDKHHRSRRRGMSRTTCMLLLISVVYIFGFLPFLALAFFKTAASEHYNAMNNLEHTFYNLFLRSYFLNCAANPIIYSLCDFNFRKECLKLMKLS